MLDTVITVDNLMDLAGSKVFWRGERYFSHNAVGRVRVMGDRIKARVQGTEVYQVELWESDGRLGYDCTCPHAADGYFCKHCVAVGLAWIGGAADRPDVDDEDGTAGSRTPTDPWKLIQSYLETQPQETLVSLLMEIVQRDDRLYQSLLLKAERGRSGSDQAKRFRRAIEDATRSFDGEWQSAEEFAEDLGPVIDALEEHIQAEATKTSQWRPRPSEPNYSSRVEIALWEEDPEAGLDASGRGTCDPQLLIRLAGQLEAGQPDEAMKLYRRIIQPTIEQTNSRAYEEAVKLIRRVGELMEQQDRMSEFREYVEGLRASYKAKRNFIKRLDAVRTACS